MFESTLGWESHAALYLLSLLSKKFVTFFGNFYQHYERTYVHNTIPLTLAELPNFYICTYPYLVLYIHTVGKDKSIRERKGAAPCFFVLLAVCFGLFILFIQIKLLHRTGKTLFHFHVLLLISNAILCMIGIICFSILISVF